jgi:hypothetical protein
VATVPLEASSMPVRRLLAVRAGRPRPGRESLRSSGNERDPQRSNDAGQKPIADITAGHEIARR